MSDRVTGRVLYLLGCAAPPVRYVEGAVRAARARGWEVCLGLTPTAAGWLGESLPGLAEATGRRVRTAPSTPGARGDWPPADVVAVAPATLNTVNAIALGLTPTWVANTGVDAVGRRIPLVVMPCVNTDYARHPQFARSLDALRAEGVRVLYGPGGFEPNPPGQGRPEAYPWHLLLDAAEDAGGRSAAESA
ncbi:flavoprotein [Streptomyces sp. B6B3]|uniref:flavoprotein n=1 Tax=Streptomyces sp. B6B3 TaxID=3153570 RepID=UPI00325DB4C1